MPAFTREPTGLLVVFERDGEDPETQLVMGLSDPARAGERALIYALNMLARRQRLQLGDKLSVVPDGADVPLSPR
jgi:hypothetical protein